MTKSDAAKKSTRLIFLGCVTKWPEPGGHKRRRNGLSLIGNYFVTIHLDFK
jgi:hypothetical protein